jgi:hypothetical protein
LFSDSIQLNGLPAPLAEVIDAYSPFHPAGQPFHRFQPHHQRLTVASSSSHGWTFRFCSVAKALALRPCRRYSSAWWAEFPQMLKHPKPSASSPTHKHTKHTAVEIKILMLKNPKQQQRNAYIFRLWL